MFFGELDDKSKKPGFSNTKHYDSLFEIGETLKYLYDNGKYNKMKNLDSNKLNDSVSSLEIYKGNKHTQRENFEKFVQDIYNQFK
ncbi:hypothetical protein SDC9_174650 [bioreactor metagenome]|uniref:Uncharacterized protein n=1 Tax=bioreactor metagenome TaxID=1076179 RepID=A0A645GMX2_9ZZZZ